MKKLFGFAIAIVLAVNMSVCAFAASPITNLNGNDSHTVSGNYVPGATATVYKMDVSWGALEFTYTDASSGTWNPETHTYSGATAGGWDWVEGSNKITVTNHSNASVNAQFSFNTSVSGIIGNFYDATKGGSLVSGAKVTLADASIGSSLGNVSNAPKADIYLQITGGQINSSKTIGTVTVTLK